MGLLYTKTAITKLSQLAESTEITPPSASTAVSLAVKPEPINLGDAWAATGAMLTGRQYGAGSGTQNAALAFCGLYGAGLITGNTERFNGSSWIASTAQTTLSSLAGTGLQNATISCGGYLGGVYAVTVNLFNGSTWTSGSFLSVGTQSCTANGKQNACLKSGGSTSVTTYLTTAEKFNGSAWSSTGGLMIGLTAAAAAGTQNSALVFNGQSSLSTYSTSAQKFNGTTWSSAGQTPYGRWGLAGAGTKNYALAFGGSTGVGTGITEKYSGNGSVWFVTGAMLNASRLGVSGAGTQNAAIGFGGNSYTTSTEKFNGKALGSLSLIRRFDDEGANGSESFLTKTQAVFLTELGAFPYADTTELSDGLTELEKEKAEVLWTAIGNANTNLGLGGSAGSMASGLTFGGDRPTSSAAAEKLIQNTWSFTAPISTATNEAAGAGIQNAALCFGGDSAAIVQSRTEHFNGSNWSLGGALATARRGHAGTGVQNAALCANGHSVSYFSSVEKYSGSVWSAAASTATPSLCRGTGTQNATIIHSEASGGAMSAEKFNGSTWSATAIPNTLYQAPIVGTQNAARILLPTNQIFNGSVWSLSGQKINSTYNDSAGSGTQNAAFSVGGYFGAGYLSAAEKLASRSTAFDAFVLTTNLYGGFVSSQ